VPFWELSVNVLRTNDRKQKAFSVAVDGGKTHATRLNKIRTRLNDQRRIRNIMLEPIQVNYIKGSWLFNRKDLPR
jgi:hypothetical protein